MAPQGQLSDVKCKGGRVSLPFPFRLSVCFFPEAGCSTRLVTEPACSAASLAKKCFQGSLQTFFKIKSTPWPIKGIAELTKDRWQEGELEQGSWSSTSWLCHSAGTRNYTSAKSETRSAYREIKWKNNGNDQRLISAHEVFVAVLGTARY